MQSKRPTAKRYARPAQAAEYLGVARSTLYHWKAKRPGFPQPIRLGENSVAFDLNEIDAFLAKQQEVQA